jgi:hypothetical protein
MRHRGRTLSARQWRRACERRIVREICRKFSIDDRDAGVDCRQSGDVLRFDFPVAILRRLRNRVAARVIAPLPLRNQILAFSNEGRDFWIAFGSARRHLRQGFRSFRTLRPLRGLEHLTQQTGIIALVRCEAMGRFNKVPKLPAALRRVTFSLSRERPADERAALHTTDYEGRTPSPIVGCARPIGSRKIHPGKVVEVRNNVRMIRPKRLLRDRERALV